MKTVFVTGGKNPFAGAKVEHLIEVKQRESGKQLFDVYYGLQCFSNLIYSEACTELGACILHNACCDGYASNEGAQ